MAAVWVSVSVLMMDLDHFKSINDEMGHLAGDSILLEVANILKVYTRDTDKVARWGGEEFVAFLPRADAVQSMAVAERIRKAIERYKFKNIGKVTVSFGVTKFKKRDTQGRFIKRADDAMYKAKKKGRNRVEVIV